jgi:glycosyltransferase involved in cell wall biosynthesis
MNILVNLVFVPQEPTGLANYSLNLLRHLQALGSSKSLASSPDSQGSQNQERLSIPQKEGYANVPQNLQIIDRHQYPRLTNDFGIRGHLRRLAWTQWQLPQIYREQRADLIFSPIPEAPLFSKCRSIVTIHDLIPLRFPQWFSKGQKFYCRYYIQQVLQQADHVLCNSQTTAIDVQQFFHISPAKLTITPLACNHDQFRFLALPPSNYFLYLGRSNPHKNVGRLIRAFAQLPQSEDYELWIAGSSDRRYTPDLVQLAASLGVGDRVKFLNYVPDAELPEMINRSIALVFPSLWEGFGLPILEAMACGTPVITSNLSALKEVAGEAALLVDPYQVKDIAGAMREIITDPSLRSHLRRLGLARAAQFTWQQTAAATQAVIQ